MTTSNSTGIWDSWKNFSGLLGALEEANKLSTKVVKEVRRLWQNNRAELLRMDGPVGLIAEKQSVFPLEVTSRENLPKSFQDFFFRLRHEWGLLSGTPGQKKEQHGADWYALILRNADPEHPVFPFIRFGGQTDKRERCLKASDLIGDVCSPGNRDKVLLLSEIGAADETASLTSISLSIMPNHNKGDMGEGTAQLEIVHKKEERRVEINMYGSPWQAAFSPKLSEFPSTQDVLEYVLTLPSMPCHFELLSDDESVIPKILCPDSTEERTSIITRLWRLANLYYWHLSLEARARIKNLPSQLHIIWHLYPYFGAHLGAGGMCEAIAEPWQGPEDTLRSYVLSPERMTLMRTVATTLMSGFDNQMLYAAEERGGVNLAHEVKRIPANICNLVVDARERADGRSLLKVRSITTSSAKEESPLYGELLLRDDLPEIVRENLGLCFYPQGVRDASALIALWCQGKGLQDVKSVIREEVSTLSRFLASLWEAAIRLLALSADPEFKFSRNLPDVKHNDHLLIEREMRRLTQVPLIAEEAGLRVQIGQGLENGGDLNLTLFEQQDVGWLCRLLLSVFFDYALHINTTEFPQTVYVNYSCTKLAEVKAEMKLRIWNQAACAQRVEPASPALESFQSLQANAKKAWPRTGKEADGERMHTRDVAMTCAGQLWGKAVPEPKRLEGGYGWDIDVKLTRKAGE